MFHHISLAAEEPSRVARVLAELTGGQFFEFPVAPGAYLVTFNDGQGSGIEVLPQDTAWMAGEVEAEARPAVLPYCSATHAALSLNTRFETIAAIGQREGWLVRLCDRGPFRVIELWIENHFMLERLTSDMTADYIHFMKPQVYANFLAAVTAAPAPAGALDKWVSAPQPLVCQ